MAGSKQVEVPGHRRRSARCVLRGLQPARPSHPGQPHRTRLYETKIDIRMSGNQGAAGRLDGPDTRPDPGAASCHRDAAATSTGTGSGSSPHGQPPDCPSASPAVGTSRAGVIGGFEDLRRDSLVHAGCSQPGAAIRVGKLAMPIRLGLLLRGLRRQTRRLVPRVGTTE